MDIKKALLFVENHAPKDYEADFKVITRALTDHLNDLVNQFEEKDNRIAELEKAIAGIAPWLRASLSDPNINPCEEYQEACERMFEVDKSMEEFKGEQRLQPERN